jgi:UPF0755 protein
MSKKGHIYRISIILLIGVTGLLLLFRVMLGINPGSGEKNLEIFVPTGAEYRQVLDTLELKNLIQSKSVFTWIANRKKYPAHIKPGRYIVNENINYLNLINLLRSGNQVPVRITFNNVRTLNDLAGKIGGKIEADSSQIITFLSDQNNYINDGFTKENVISVFIPDTYEIFWNTSADGLYKRMLREYKTFWNQTRLNEANEKGLNPIQVGILASIIDDEVVKPEEKPRIAGVYLNRLNRGMPLQACPTIKYALNDFTITRILDEYLKIDSPYNTYIHKGFPPGPIRCPSIEGIEAVLNAEKHDYIFFAAKADFSGYHNFSRTLAEHNRYAAEYQRELDKRKIYR